MSVSPNLSYHYWQLGIKPAGKTAIENPLVLIRGTEFEPEKEIEHDDDVGHTGTGTTKMEQYRKSATSSPKFGDKCRYGEGLEDLWFMLFGDVTGPTPAVTGATKAKKYVFSIDPADPETPPFATLYNGYAKTADDAYIYDNCLLNELEVKFSNDEPMSINPSFVSDYPLFNQANPARVIPEKKVRINAGQTVLYYAPTSVTLTDQNKATYAYPCVLEGTIKINNNAESEPCAGDDFGKSTKTIGERESDGGFKVPWTEETKGIEAEYQSGSTSGQQVSSNTLNKQIMIESIGALIETVTGTPDVPVYYKQKILIPNATITKCESPQSGDEAKSIEAEFKINDTGVASFMTVEIISELTALHIGTL